jgi:hypothetical protein
MSLRRRDRPGGLAQHHIGSREQSVRGLIPRALADRAQRVVPRHASVIGLERKLPEKGQLRRRRPRGVDHAVQRRKHLWGLALLEQQRHELRQAAVGGVDAPAARAALGGRTRLGGPTLAQVILHRGTRVGDAIELQRDGRVHRLSFPAPGCERAPALHGAPGGGQVLAGEPDLAGPLSHRCGGEQRRLRVGLGGRPAVTALQGDFRHDGHGGGIGLGCRRRLLGRTGAPRREHCAEGGNEKAAGADQDTHSDHYRASPSGAHGLQCAPFPRRPLARARPGAVPAARV